MASSGQIWIKSNHFPVEEGEDSETNPGVYGRAFSRWLSEKLQAKGERTLDIVAEDWGRCIVLREKPLTFVGCANQWGQTEIWGVFVEVKGNLLSRFIGGNDGAQQEVQRLQALIQQIMGDAEEISEVSVDPN